MNNQVEEPLTLERFVLKRPNDKIGFSSISEEFYNRHFPASTPSDWSSWQWQIRNSITSISRLSQLISLTDEEFRPEGNKN